MNATVARLARTLNKPALLHTAENLKVAVTVIDAKEVYGQVRYLVIPENGKGEAWVSSDRVVLKEP